MKRIILLICSLLLTGCDISNPNYEETKNDFNNLTTATQDNESTKVYKMNSEEYFEYIKNTVDEVCKINNIFYIKSQIKRSEMYIFVSLYPNKYVEKNKFEEENEFILNEVFSNLKKNDYKSGGILASNYEYLYIDFYNFVDKNSKKIDKFESKLFHITEIKNYSSYETYISKHEK